MFMLGTAVFAFVCAAMCFSRYNTLKNEGSKTDYDTGGGILAMIGMIFVLLAFIFTGAEYYYQLSDIENIKKFQEIESVYKKKADDLSAEFAGYLAQKYPEHEKKIFDKIGPENVQIYLVKYPEIRASETIMKLVEHINKLQSDVYDQQVKMAGARKSIRLRLRNPWILNFVLPKE
ncbi:MAG: hypothetical protein A2931_02035 [Candidatus Niyogibacteria bacterium RIFCSPLOWO2_01_FULL_45_48]|uniref:Uncharacterized protein n=2 Tax=Candidatus Niyogiibacteriota TaxID=1817912 RepID=A0A1G2EXZ7_9BACT|nr:MAG: hypothetical protein A2931_02035 [Candidatus Niyogibacteria bacterium RIFCSPLOWO2_01_FULL_45_48]